MKRAHSYWSTEEDARLRALWWSAPLDDLLAAFPGRNYSMINGRARRLDLKRSREFARASYVARRRPEVEAFALRIQAHRRAGLSFADTGRLLGISRNAAIGRMHRFEARQKAEAKAGAAIPEFTAWGRELDRSSGFPMPMLRI